MLGLKKQSFFNSPPNNLYNSGILELHILYKNLNNNSTNKILDYYKKSCDLVREIFLKKFEKKNVTILDKTTNKKINFNNVYVNKFNKKNGVDIKDGVDILSLSINDINWTLIKNQRFFIKLLGWVKKLKAF